MTDEPEITVMSEKGQIVIPQSLRKHLGIEPRMKFLVFGEGDVIVLKRLQIPDVATEWEGVFRLSKGKGAKMTEAAVGREVQAHRKSKR